MLEPDTEKAFTEFVDDVGPKLRQALKAVFGPALRGSAQPRLYAFPVLFELIASDYQGVVARARRHHTQVSISGVCCHTRYTEERPKADWIPRRYHGVDGVRYPVTRAADKPVRSPRHPNNLRKGKSPLAVQMFDEVTRNVRTASGEPTPVPERGGHSDTQDKSETTSSKRARNADDD